MEEANRAVRKRSRLPAEDAERSDHLAAANERRGTVRAEPPVDHRGHGLELLERPHARLARWRFSSREVGERAARFGRRLGLALPRGGPGEIERQFLEPRQVDENGREVVVHERVDGAHDKADEVLVAQRRSHRPADFVEDRQFPHPLVDAALELALASRRLAHGRDRTRQRLDESAGRPRERFVGRAGEEERRPASLRAAERDREDAHEPAVRERFREIASPEKRHRVLARGREHVDPRDIEPAE